MKYYFKEHEHQWALTMMEFKIGINEDYLKRTKMKLGSMHFYGKVGG